MRSFLGRGLRRAAVLTAFASVLVAASGVALLADTEAVTFKLENGTDLVMIEFYASPPGTDDWEEDIFGDGVLEPGYTVDVTIDDGREDCTYDFLAVFDNGDEDLEIEVQNVTVCEGESYVFTGE